jgi:hypothetical protein
LIEPLADVPNRPRAAFIGEQGLFDLGEDVTGDRCVYPRHIGFLVAGFPGNFDDVDSRRPDAAEKFGKFRIAHNKTVLQSAVSVNARRDVFSPWVPKRQPERITKSVPYSLVSS